LRKILSIKILKDIRKENPDNKYLSRISTNTHLDDLDKLLEHDNVKGNKNIYVSPNRNKKLIAESSLNESSITNNYNYMYGKQNDPYGNLFKMPISNTLNPKGHVNSNNNNTNNFNTKCESPYRNKQENNIIDQIINENKDKFYDEFDIFGGNKHLAANPSKKDKLKIGEKDFGLFYDSEKKPLGARKQSGYKAQNDENKIGKIDFESRRKNKVSEILEDGDFEFMNNKNEFKKQNNFNYKFNKF